MLSLKVNNLCYSTYGKTDTETQKEIKEYKHVTRELIPTQDHSALKKKIQKPPLSNPKSWKAHPSKKNTHKFTESEIKMINIGNKFIRNNIKTHYNNNIFFSFQSKNVLRW